MRGILLVLLCAIAGAGTGMAANAVRATSDGGEPTNHVAPLESGILVEAGHVALMLGSLASGPDACAKPCMMNTDPAELVTDLTVRCLKASELNEATSYVRVSKSAKKLSRATSAACGSIDGLLGLDATAIKAEAAKRVSPLAETLSQYSSD